MKEKLEALEYCINEDDCEEDVLGHLGCLFHYHLELLNKNLSDDNLPTMTPQQAFEHYFSNPTPIIGPNALDRIVKKL